VVVRVQDTVIGLGSILYGMIVIIGKCVGYCDRLRIYSLLHASYLLE